MIFWLCVIDYEHNELLHIYHCSVTAVVFISCYPGVTLNLSLFPER